MLSREEALNLNLNEINKIHFIGITSPFNSFCATKLLEMGKVVTASQHNQDSKEAKKWIDNGILYAGGHDKKYIHDDLDLVVFPNGIVPGNSECKKAKQLGLKIMTNGQLTGLLSKDLKTIAVAGTHGKTTTTALIVWALSQLDKEPNFLCGDKILGLNKTWNENKESEYLVVEACEYKRQFLDRAPSPYISVITHIDLDHTDYYKDQDDYNQAFVEFLSNTTKDIIIDLVSNNEFEVIDSINNIDNVEITDVSKFRNMENRLKSTLRGDFNKENLLRAYITCDKLGFDKRDILESLKDFPGVSKRFEYVGLTQHTNPVYKDYAHNPSKIKACIESAKEEIKVRWNGGGKVLLVWQPHSHERTYNFRDEFVDVLRYADVVLICDIFSPTRESKQDKKLISAKDFVEYANINSVDITVEYSGDLEDTIPKIKKYENAGRFVIVLASAGDLHEMASELVV